MSDARWFEVEEDVAAATAHFTRSVAIFAAGGFDGDGLEAYKTGMAFMHAMQSGHTSLEAALLRILALLGEDAPAGPDRHSDLIRRIGRSIPGRPAILPPALAAAANETRRFRHLAMKSYGHFEAGRAQPAVDAASVLAGGLEKAVAAFRRAVDPGEDETGPQRA